MSIKTEVKRLLNTKRFEQIADLAEQERRVVRYLFSFLYSTDDLLHWRAAEALGFVAGREGARGRDGQRNIPRRLVWSLAEESGSTAWPAPEGLGAVVAHQPNSYLDFGRIVLSFIEDPILRRGVLWSARKIAEKRPDLVQDSSPAIIELLDDPDPTTRGHAAWALGVTYNRDAIDKLKELQQDTSPLTIYNKGELQHTTVGELATMSLAELRKWNP